MALASPPEPELTGESKVVSVLSSVEVLESEVLDSEVAESLVLESLALLSELSTLSLLSVVVELESPVLVDVEPSLSVVVLMSVAAAPSAAVPTTRPSALATVTIAVARRVRSQPVRRASMGVSFRRGPHGIAPRYGDSRPSLCRSCARSGGLSHATSAMAERDAVSRNCDRPAMMRGHPISSVKNMIRTKLATLALLATAGLALTGCSIGITGPDDDATSASKPSPSPSTAVDRSDDDDADDPDDDASGSSGLGSIGVTNGPCAGRSFEVADDDVSLVLTGACGAVVVSGDGVTVNYDGSNSLKLTGDDITVITNGPVGTVEIGGENNSLNGSELESVAISGDLATVLGTRIGSLTVTGSYNTVNWDSGVAAASDTGMGNTYIRA